MGKLEETQYFPEEKGGAEEIAEKDWQTLKVIAQRVGGDFGMKVRLGEAGGGSFFDPETVSITFDPLHIKENPNQVKFVAGHEGSHRAITPNPKELSLPQEKIRELYSQIGFGYLQNAVEDPAVNSWMVRRFPGLKQYTQEVYNQQLKEENAILSTPEVERIAIRLGYWPRFVQYGSEVIRYWHQGKFSESLDPAVRKALQRTIADVHKSIETIPDPQKNLERQEVIVAGQERFKNNTNYIWPEVKKLVEMDLHTEEQRQMMEEFKQKQKELEQKRKEIQQAKREGDQQKAEELQKEIRGLEQELSPFNQLPKNVRKELQKQIDKTMREAAERLNKEIKEKQKQGEKDLKEIQDALEQIQSGEEVPYPEDRLSEKTKQEIEKLFQKLPSSKRKKYRQRAKEKLEDLEDTLNQEMEGKLNEDKPKSHREEREREAQEREARQKSEEARIERERVEESLERIRKKIMTPYEQTREKVVGLIDDLYFRLRRILKPGEYGGEELGYPAGQRLDISRAMQAEKDIDQKYRLWIRETSPGKKDYCFWHLIDLSGSMAGKKIKETFKGFIMAGEAIDRLEDLNSDTITIHQGITGFHERIFPFKEPTERLTKRVEDRLSTMPERTHDKDAGTNTYLATLFALEQLKQARGETGNFLFIFSDGNPNNDIRNKLKELLKNGKAERDRLKIKIGLIWLGEKNDEKALQELVEAYGYDFGLVMPAIKSGKGKTFSEGLAELLEDIVENPEKY